MTDRPLRARDGDDTDAAIDRAVREMMSGEPAAGFRQRVLARLERDADTAGTWSAWLTAPRLGLAALAAALIVALALWTRSAERPIEQPVLDAHRAPAASQPLPREPERSAPPPQPVPRIAERHPGTSPAGRVTAKVPDRRVSAASIAAAEEALEREAARSPIDPINVPPIQSRPIEPGEIIITPVTVGPLKIVPLLPPR